MTLRVAVTGAGGQLGRSLRSMLATGSRHRLVAAWSHAELDVALPGAVARGLDACSERPDVVVNAAAFTFVDRCESEPELARRVNAEAPGLLARACHERGVALVHVSTDYVFRGASRSQGLDEDDAPDPISVYGRTKLEGEQRVLAEAPGALVVRACWLFGPGRNFVRTMIEQAQARRADPTLPALRVVDDQFGCPTYTDDLARGLLALVEAGARGVYHLAARGVATWWDLARESLDRTGHGDLPIERIATHELPRPAPRPAWSVLDCGKAERLGVRLPAWRDGLAGYLASSHSPSAAESAKT